MTLALALLLACGDAPPSAEAPAPSADAPAAEAPATPAAAPAETIPPDADPAEVHGARPSPKAMDGLPAEVCGHPCAVLTVHDFQYVQDNYCQLCGPHDEWACDVDWPTNDVPLCSRWDEMRNCIYAYYGYSFTSDKWTAFFAEQGWYKPDPNYSEDRLSEVAQRNVAFLKDAKAKKWNCAGE